MSVFVAACLCVQPATLCLANSAWLQEPTGANESGSNETGGADKDDTGSSATSNSAFSERADSDQVQLQLGFGGAWKLGHVSPLRVRLSGSLVDQARVIEVETADGDGVGLTYRHVLQNENAASDHWISVRIGRAGSRFEVRILGSDDRLLAAKRPNLNEFQSLPSDQYFVVALGNDLGVSELRRTNRRNSDSSFSTAVIESADQLPTRWQDYASCDVIVISSQNLALLKDMSIEQWQAIDTWIRRGGGAVFSMEIDEPEFLEDPQKLQLFQAFLPGEIQGQGRVRDPGALESLVATDQPLGDLSVMLMEPTKGQVELFFTDTLNRQVPWWTSYAHGAGSIHFVASDLAAEEFANWKDRKRFLARLLSPYMDPFLLEGSQSESAVGASSYLGYNDLVGQLRASLDVFPSVRVISFGQVVVLLVAILLLVGPLDYLLSVKWLKRPSLSWFFAGGLLVAVSLGLTWFYASLRPDEVRMNTAQVLDIDVQSNLATGRLWTHVYSGKAHLLDVQTEVAMKGQFSKPGIGSIHLDWQGLPGKGLGGLLSQFGNDRGIPAYQIHSADGQSSRIAGLSIPAAGTKSLVGQWVGEIELHGESSLREIAGVAQLSGELFNPLDVDIKEPMLFYHNWFYHLNSRIPANGSTTIAFDTIPKDLSRRLNRRRNMRGQDAVTKWDPADRESLDRLLELMMFYKVASGKSYTSLKHRYQPLLDQSNLLATDRAILVGRIETPPVSIQVKTSDGSAVDIQQDIDRVWCRIVIPVQQPDKN